MKIKNIAIGDLVQVKKSMSHSKFKAKQVCQVIDIDPIDKYGLDVLIQGNNCLDWVKHKDLKKPEPQLKQLDQSAFDHPYATNRFKYAALNADGQAIFFESKPVISNCLDIWVVHTGSVMPMLKGYDASNWQNSLIERDVDKEPAEVDLTTTTNDFKDDDLVFELDFANGIKLANLKKVGRLASEDYDFQTRYGYNYLKDGRAYPIFSIPHLIHATTENRKALVTLYGEKAVPQLPSEAAIGDGVL